MYQRCNELTSAASSPFLKALEAMIHLKLDACLCNACTSVAIT